MGINDKFHLQMVAAGCRQKWRLETVETTGLFPIDPDVPENHFWGKNGTTEHGLAVVSSFYSLDELAAVRTLVGESDDVTLLYIGRWDDQQRSPVEMLYVEDADYGMVITVGFPAKRDGKVQISSVRGHAELERLVGSLEVERKTYRGPGLIPQPRLHFSYDFNPDLMPEVMGLLDAYFAPQDG